MSRDPFGVRQDRTDVILLELKSLQRACSTVRIQWHDTPTLLRNRSQRKWEELTKRTSSVPFIFLLSLPVLRNTTHILTDGSKPNNYKILSSFSTFAPWRFLAVSWREAPFMSWFPAFILRQDCALYPDPTCNFPADISNQFPKSFQKRHKVFTWPSNWVSPSRKGALAEPGSNKYLVLYNKGLVGSGEYLWSLKISSLGHWNPHLRLELCFWLWL